MSPVNINIKLYIYMFPLLCSTITLQDNHTTRQSHYKTITLQDNHTTRHDQKRARCSDK